MSGLNRRSPNATLAVTLIVVALQAACVATSVQSVGLADLEQPDPKDIHGVITINGEQVDFDYHATLIRNDTIYAFVDHRPYAIGLDHVDKVQVERVNEGMSLLQTVLAVSVPLVTFAIFSSMAPIIG